MLAMFMPIPKMFDSWRCCFFQTMDFPFKNNNIRGFHFSGCQRRPAPRNSATKSRVAVLAGGAAKGVERVGGGETRQILGATYGKPIEIYGKQWVLNVI